MINFFSKKKVSPAAETKYAVPSSYTLMLNGYGNVYAFDHFPIEEIIASFTTISPLNTGIMKIANAVSSLPYQLYDKKTKKVITSHPFLTRLQHPNNDDQKTFCDLVRDCVVWKMLEGDAFLSAVGDINREPLSLYVLKPQDMTALVERAVISRYTYSNQWQVLYFNRTPDARYLTDSSLSELWVWTNFNPFSRYLNPGGMSEVMPLYYEVNLYLQASGHNLQLIKNGLRPSGALVLKASDGTPASLTNDQFERLKQQMQDQYSGAENAGRPMLLEGGLEWQPMGLNPKDMDFSKLREQCEHQIYKNLGVPIELVTDAAKTYNNVATAQVNFYQDRIIPMGQAFADWITQAVLHTRYQNSENLELQVNIDAVNALTPLRQERRKTIQDSPIMTVNEKRVELGLMPIPGMDVIVTPAGYIVNDSANLQNVTSDIKRHYTQAEFKTLMLDNGLDADAISKALKHIYHK